MRVPPTPPAGYTKGPACPFCHRHASRVTDSRVTSDGACVRRRRQCHCARRFTTYEQVAQKTGATSRNYALELPAMQRALRAVRKVLDGLLRDVRRWEAVP